MNSSMVEVVNSKGCSRFFPGFSASIPSLNNLRSMEVMSTATSMLSEPVDVGPFTGIVICVTGLSKEARTQVMAATERLGGHYSSSLHPQCTHLVVQSCSGRKFEHALKHGQKNGLVVVTLGWFVDSVKKNVRLSESLYSVRNAGENGMPLGELNQILGLPGAEKSCLPARAFEGEKPLSTNWQIPVQFPRKELKSDGSLFSSECIYIDSDISNELKKKVIDAATREGAIFLKQWFIGCPASHVVCEGPSIQRYMGHTNNLVTPLWILKTVKENSLQRLVHLSSDLARQVVMILENAQSILSGQDVNVESIYQTGKNIRKFLPYKKGKETLEERQKIADVAKLGVKSRRYRRMQLCQTPIYPITPTSLLDSICWSVSEPTSSTCIYTESSGPEDASEQHTTEFFDARSDGRDSDLSFDNLTRSLREREKREVVFKNSFFTILFPTDRFGELGPTSRTFFSSGGFSCLQLLEYIYNFYQENMSPEEIEVAIHTDSRHADRLRTHYASKESADQGFVSFKRIEFLGSRRSFEALKRISGDNNSNVYQLLIRA